MTKKPKNKRCAKYGLKEIERAIAALIKSECWNFLNDIYKDLTPQVWRLDTDVLVVYANASQKAKDKISNRQEFVDVCVRLYPEELKDLT